MPTLIFRTKLWPKLNKKQIITCIGIDPGLGRLGFALVRKDGHCFSAEDYGCIETPPKTDVPLRLEMIYNKLGEWIQNCSPDFMSVEKLFFGRNITTAEYVWQARGIILLLASQYKLPVYEPKPSQIKVAVCGSGSADKKQVQKMVQRLLNLKEIPQPDDAADAIAIALTGIALHSFSRKTKAGGFSC